MLNPPPKLDTVDVRSIRRWLNALRDYVASLPSRGDMKTIRVNGGTISAVTQPRISQGGGGGGGGGRTNEYRGPFAVVKETDTSVRVLGYNAEAGRFFRSYLILALKSINILEVVISGITTDGHIVVNITRTGQEYSTPIQFVAGAIPTQTNTNFYHILAFVRCEDSKIVEIVQYQYGIIQHPSRFL